MGNLFRAPSSPAKIMNANPALPNTSPGMLAPLGPCGERRAYGTYTAVAAASVAAEAIIHRLCVLSIRNDILTASHRRSPARRQKTFPDPRGAPHRAGTRRRNLALPGS